jgi:hypothetical protein
MIGNFSERPESLMKLKRHVIERRCDTCDRDYSRLLICQFRRRAVARDVAPTQTTEKAMQTPPSWGT